MSERARLLIEELGARLDLEGMTLDEDNSGLIRTVEDIDVGYTYDEEDDALAIYAQVGRIPGERRDELYATLLRANFGWEQNRGATLSISPRDDVVVQKSVDLESADLESLEKHFTNFFHWAALASAEISQGAAGAHDTNTAVEPPPPIDPFLFA